MSSSLCALRSKGGEDSEEGVRRFVVGGEERMGRFRYAKLARGPTPRGAYRYGDRPDAS